MELEVIYKQDLKQGQITILNIGGIIIDRPFEEPLYLAPYAPQPEIDSLLDQVADVDQEEVRGIWQKIQQRLRISIGTSL